MAKYPVDVRKIIDHPIDRPLVYTMICHIDRPLVYTIDLIDLDYFDLLIYYDLL